MAGCLCKYCGACDGEPHAYNCVTILLKSSPVVPGVGPDAEIVTNEKGAKQSKTLYRCDLLPAQAMLALAEVLKHGADKYGANNWRDIAPADHLNHAMVHMFAHLVGDTSDDHAGHALCRVTMWVECLKTANRQQV